jgi:cell envelope opacity-associated protein A
MSTRCYTLSYLYSKDESQNFVAQLRDSSDVTSMIKQQAIRQNYSILHDKGLSPVGGIPATDLYAMAHTTGAYAPMSGLISGISMQPCVSCTGQFPFNLTKVSVSLIRY